MPLLERIGLGNLIGFQLRAIISIVSGILALVALDRRQVLLAIWVGTILTIVPLVMSIAVTIVMIMGVIAPVSTIGPVAIGVVAVIVVAISLAEVTSMTVEIVTPTALRRVMLLVRELTVVLVAAKLPLA